MAFVINSKLTVGLDNSSYSDILIRLKRLENTKINLKIGLDAASINQLKSLGETLKGITTSSTSVTSNLNNVATATTRVASSAQSASASVSRYSNNIKGLTAEVNAAGVSVERFGQLTSLALRRFAAFTVSAGSVFLFIRALREGIKAGIDFNLQMNRLLQVSQGFRGDVTAISDTIRDLSTNLGISSGELAKAAVTIRSAGINATDTATALEALAKAASSPNFGSITETTEGLIAVYQQFGKDASNLKSQLGSLNAVAAETATEASDLISAITKAGGAFHTAGGNLNEFLALFSSVRSTTRESADSIATGFRTIFGRLQRPEAVDGLKKLGIELRYVHQEAEALGDVDLEQQFVGPYEAVKRLSEGLSKIRTTDPRYASVVEELGGVRQISRILPLIQQFGEAQKALNIAKAGGASIELAAIQRQEALSTQFAKTKEEFNKLISSIVESKGFQSLISNITSLTTGLIHLADTFKGLLPLAAAFAAVSVARRVPAFGRGLLNLPNERLNLKYASGGTVGGSGRGDKIHIMAEPGEFIVKREAAQSIGAGPLREMNRTGRIPKGYADGDFVYEDVVKKYVEKIKPRQKNIDVDDMKQEAFLKALLQKEKLTSKYSGADLEKAIEKVVFGRSKNYVDEERRSLKEFSQVGVNKQGKSLLNNIKTQEQYGEDFIPGAQGVLAGKPGKKTKADIQKVLTAAYNSGDLNAEQVAAARAKGYNLPTTAKAFPASGTQPSFNPGFGLKYPTGASSPTFPFSANISTNKSAPPIDVESTVTGRNRGLALPSGPKPGTIALPPYTGYSLQERLDRPDLPLPINPGYGYNLSNSNTIGTYNTLPPLPLVGTQKPKTLYDANARVFKAGAFSTTGYSNQPTGSFDKAAPQDLVKLAVQDSFNKLSRFEKISPNATLQAGEKALTAVQEKLTQATYLQLEKVNKGATAAQNLALAQEFTVNALKKNSDVYYNAGKNQFGGLPELGAANFSSPGKFGRIRNFFSGGARAIGSNFARQFGPGGNGVYGTAIAGGLLGDYFFNSAGQAAPDSGAGYSAKRGAAGALTGAAVGATLGSFVGTSALPGIGTAVGAVTGALIGLVVALKDAADDIKSAKIGNGVQELSNKLAEISRRGTGYDDNNALNNLNATRQQLFEKAQTKGSHFFTGTDYKEVDSFYKAEFTKAFAPQLLQIVQTLDKRAVELTKQNPNENSNQILQRLQQGFTGGLLNVSSQLNGPNLKDYEKLIKDTQREVSANKNRDRAAAEIERLDTAFGKLVIAVEGAAVSIERLEGQAATTAAVFSGRGPTPITPLANTLAQNGSPNSQEFIQAITQVLKPLGESGQRLLNTNIAVDRIESVLPDVLVKATSTPVLDGDTIGIRVRDGVLAALKDKDLTGGKEFQAVLELLVRNLSLGDVKTQTDLLEQIQRNPVKFSSQEIDKASQDAKKSALEIEKQTTANANKFLEGLIESSRQLTVFREALDKAADAKLLSQRLAAEVESQRTGVSPTNLLSLQQLQAPFQGRQANLGGLGTPEQLFVRLQRVQEQIPGARNALERGYTTQNDLDKNTRRLTDLTDEADKLKRALANLGDVANRVAPLQEKLGALYASRDSRRGFVEQYINADPSQQARLQLGQILVGQADKNPNSVKRFSNEELKILFETLNALGNSTLKSGASANLLKGNLLDIIGKQFGGAGTLSPQQKTEATQLEDAIKKISAESAKAAELLAKSLESENKRFVGQLLQVQDVFFARLEANRAQVEKDVRINEAGKAGSKKTELQGLENQRLGIENLGIDFKTNNDVEKLEKNRKYIADFVKSREGAENFAQERRISNPFNKVISDEDVQRYKSASSREAKESFFADIIGRTGARNVQPSDINNIAQNVFDSFSSGRFGNVAKEGVTKEILTRAINDAFNQNTQNGIARLQQPSTAAAQDLAKTYPGIKTENLNTISLKKIDDAINAFSKSGQNIEKLGQELQIATTYFNKVNTEAETLQANFEILNAIAEGKAQAVQIQAQGKAMGGSIFSPQGTDTIPAMLTPNEFVVNAASAQANLGLLNAINNARGPIYFADGGEVPWWKRDGIDAIQRRRKLPRIGQREEQSAEPPLYQAPETAEDRKERRRQRRANNRFVSGLFNRVNNANYGNLFYQQAIARSATLPGEESQLAIAAGALDYQNQANNANAQLFFGSRFYGLQKRSVQDSQQLFPRRRYSQGGAVYLADGGIPYHTDTKFLLNLLRQRRQGYEQGIQNTFLPVRGRGIVRNPLYEGAYNQFEKDLLGGNKNISDAEVNKQYEGDFSRYLNTNPSLIRGKRQIRNERAITDLFANLKNANQNPPLSPRQRAADKEREDRANIDAAFAKERRNPLSVYANAEKRANDKVADRDRQASYGRVTRYYNGYQPPVERKVDNITDELHSFLENRKDERSGKQLKLSMGGMVNAKPIYRAAGGPVGSSGTNSGVNDSSSRLANALIAFSAQTGGLVSGFATFDTSVSKLAAALEKFPEKMTVEGKVMHEVVINGAAALEEMEPMIKKMIAEQAENQINKAFKDRIPEA